MNSLAILHHDHQRWTHGAAQGGACVGGFGIRAPAYDDRQFPAAHTTSSSRSCRQLAGVLTRPGVFIRCVRERAATRFAAANQSSAQSHFQCVSEADEAHFVKSFRKPVLDGHDANENGLTHAQTSFAPGAKGHD